MTRFLESFATQQLLPPWRADGVTVTAFLFELKAHVIQRYLDRFLNFPPARQTPFHYRALKNAQFGIIIITDYPSICSTNTRNMRRYGTGITQWDHLKQTEFFVGVPVEKYDVGPDNIMTNREIQWIQPIVISDNASVVFASREIVGVDMLFGRVETSPDPEPGGVHYDCWLPSLRTFSPTSKEEWLPFAHVRSGAPLAEPPPEVLAALGGPGAGGDPVLEGLKAVLGEQSDPMVRGFLPVAMRMVTLKQFRDAYNLDLASYQALVGATISHKTIRDLRFFDPKRAEISFMSTATTEQILTSFLDLHEGSAETPPPHPGPSWDLVALPAPVRFAFRFTADVTFDQVETLHVVGGSGAAA
jgi:hypothetical protein